MAARLRAYYGSVDYDGALQDGTPFQTTTEYYGALLEGRYGYRAGLGRTYYLDLMGSVGIDFWLRSVDPGGAAGVNEYWLPFYCKAGLEVSPSAEKGWVAALGIKLPFYTLETVDVGGDVYTLNPKPRVSPYAEAGYQFTRSLSARAFFDSYWFGESDLDSSGTVFQPESKSYQVGAKLGWSF
jgi:hypothetical protein